MEIIKIDTTEKKLYHDIFPYLIGKVFHMTTHKNLDNIIIDGYIDNNKDHKYEYTYTLSEASFGRMNGDVCMFDLKNPTCRQMYFHLRKMVKISLYPDEGQPAYLITKSEIHNELKLYTDLSESIRYKVFCVPYVECWFPNRLPIDKISTILKVTITDKGLAV